MARAEERSAKEVEKAASSGRQGGPMIPAVADENVVVAILSRVVGCKTDGSCKMSFFKRSENTIA